MESAQQGNKQSSKNLYLLLIVVLVIFLVLAGLYLKKTGFKSSQETKEAPATSAPATQKVIGTPKELPPEINYEIIEVTSKLIKVKTDKGEAGYSKKFIDDREVYKTVDGQKVVLTYNDLKVGQKVVVHTTGGKEVVGFEIFE